MNLQETCKAIQTVKIQGAEHITTAALNAFRDTIKKSHTKEKKDLMKELKFATEQLIQTRPTEPEMRNYLHAVWTYGKTIPGPTQKMKQLLIQKINQLQKQRKENEQQIIFFGESLIQANDIIYTHCHSSTVTKILLKANKRKKITVRNTETRPLFQGRITAQILAKDGIPVQHFIDAAMATAMKHANGILIGADAITSEGVYNKMGSELLALLANHYHIPLYVCTSLWKFDAHREKIEQRKGTEIWQHHPKGIEIHNPAFEKIHHKHIKEIVCEGGILKPKIFIKKAKRCLEKSI